MLFPVSGETKLCFQQCSPILNQEILSSTSQLPTLSWAAPSLGPQGLGLALVHTQQQSLPMASELRQESLKTQEWHEVQNCCRASSWTLVIFVGPFQLRMFCGYIVSKCAQKQKEYYSSLRYRPHTWASCDCRRQSCFLLPAGWRLFYLMGTREAS